MSSNAMATGPTKPKGKRLKAGDVFEFDAPDGRLGYGAIIRGGGVPFVIILKSLHDMRPTQEVISSDEIALVGWTMDAHVYHGRWRIIGHDFPERADIPFPNFKVRIGDDFYVTDVDGKPIDKATAEERALLNYQSSRAPIAYQKAFEALHGFGEWQESYKELTSNYARARMTRAA